MKTAQEIFDQLNSIDENVRIEAKRASYIAGTNFVNGNAIGENGNAIGENGNATGENSNATGKSGNVKSPLNSRGGSLNSRVADALNGRAIPLPKDLEEKLTKIGKRSKPEAMKELIIELCNLGPMSLQELANILKRKPSSLRYLYVNSLIGEHKLFHTIPEMLNHPDQKYTTVKNK